ncbi:MAG: hypothetical protein AAGH45_05935 [Pseudomonadota bacterium]
MPSPSDTRKKQLADQLRANLRRRKDQARRRAATHPSEPGEPAPQVGTSPDACQTSEPPSDAPNAAARPEGHTDDTPATPDTERPQS